MSRLSSLLVLVLSIRILTACDDGKHKAAPATIELYTSHCSSCHEVGAANAPRRGDMHQWGKRLKKGEEQLLNSIKAGLVAMPPKGGCATCTDDDFRALIRYMSQE